MLSSRPQLVVALLIACHALPSAVGRDRSGGGPEHREGVDWAFVVVGLPGDPEHERLFADTLAEWRSWLTERLEFDPVRVRVLFGGGEGILESATRGAVQRQAGELRSALGKQDRLWVFLLGHGSFDGEHAFFHLPGPDLRDDEWGALFQNYPGTGQVFVLTGSASGWFLPALSAPGRIVITATAPDNEFNETEFPHALATVSRLPPTKLDADRDGRISVLEWFEAVVAEVQARFAADNRLPTEHAQLDDNGDGKGSEQSSLRGDGKEGRASGAEPAGDRDGRLAARTFLPFP